MLAARSLIDVIWATATRTDLAEEDMAESGLPARDCTENEFKREVAVRLCLGRVDDNLIVLGGRVLRVRWKQNDMSFELKKRTLTFYGSHYFTLALYTPKFVCELFSTYSFTFFNLTPNFGFILIHALITVWRKFIVNIIHIYF